MGFSALALGLLLLFLMLVWAGVAQAAPALEAHGSVEQVYATGLAPGAKVTLYDGSGDEVGSKTPTNSARSLFREVTPGSGYSLGVGDARSESVRVLTQKSAPPNTSIYDQTIEPHGYQYLTTRDGTKLSIDVHPPQDVLKLLTGAIPSPERSAPAPKGLPSSRNCRRRSRKGTRQDPGCRRRHRRAQRTARQSRNPGRRQAADR